MTFGRLAAHLLRAMSLKERMKKRALAALGVVQSFSATAPGGVHLQLNVAPTVGVADSGDPEEDLADLLTTIGEVGQAGNSGALFLLDEMQNLGPDDLGAICMAYHRMSQRDLPSVWRACQHSGPAAGSTQRSSRRPSRRFAGLSTWCTTCARTRAIPHARSA